MTRERSILRAAERELAASLDAERPQRDAVDVALMATRAARIRVLSRISAVGVSLLTIVSLGAALWTGVIPDLRRLLAPQPPAELRTVVLSCLSPEQATQLLRPYLPRPENPRWQAEAYDVFPLTTMHAITIRAPGATIRAMRQVLAPYEQQANGVCARL